MLIEKQHKAAFVLSDALIGLVLISTGLILYGQAQVSMSSQLEQRQERVVELRHQFEDQFKQPKQVAK
ncbi:hypothetical protein HC026_04605 [Lactobacillus sp. LC28-10]|uniref:Uncharacterized protein n=1 Tax=Secundilactobacillus angelensis TaxID=2722706 RepID=A0ABX1KY99_9LACO|nr:hypothetical protein [Secundilactobacillus angelensis]MCH5462604.1 hypothetical protein [Secundilactobacillus angelensis]NLR18205.1 hypothetical protein [Secundilactobacillus angelensis]